MQLYESFANARAQYYFDERIQFTFIQLRRLTNMCVSFIHTQELQ